jgi:hypothetical protein
VELDGLQVRALTSVAHRDKLVVGGQCEEKKPLLVLDIEPIHLVLAWLAALSALLLMASL